MSVTAFESITVAGTAIGFTTATYANNIKALVTVESGAVRFRADGTDPTAAIGHVLEMGDVLTVDKSEFSKIRFIRKDGVSATLRVSYEV